VQPSERHRLLRFGPFEADPSAGELRKNGNVVRLQEQPFQVLLALLEHPGQVVAREELRARLWPSDTFGEFDQGLNTAINKLRDALGDSAANPRFIETLPKRGYRFIQEIQAPELTPSTTTGPPPHQHRKRIAAYIAAGVLLAGSGLAIAVRRPAANETLPFRHFTLRFDAPTSLTPDQRLIAVSPNGKHIAIINRDKRSTIWLQDLEQPQTRLLAGTENTSTVFWSPDSTAIGYVADVDAVKTISIDGGSGMLVCKSPAYVSGASWNPDGRSIVFASGTPSSLYVVPASGGSPAVLVAAETGDASSALRWLNEPHFLRTAGNATKLLYSNRGVFVLRDMATGVEHVVGNGRNGAYSPTGHLVYRSGGDLVARRFSPERSTLDGEPFLVASTATDPSVASDGTLVYRDLVTSQLVWRDRAGTRLGTVGPPADGLFYPALSPNGRRVAVEILDSQTLNIWVIDVDRGTRLRLSSSASADILPVWSPEGDHVAYSSYRAGNLDIFSRQADAARDEVVIAGGLRNERISDWSRDGELILHSIYPANSDLMYLKRGSGGRWESHPLLDTPANEHGGKFSPDGRYVAYLSDESGRDELYIREFVPAGRKWPVSANGASQMRWGWDGQELFYSEAGMLMAVPVGSKRSLTVGSPKRLFSHPAFNGRSDAQYDVSPDGQRIILPERVGEQERVIHVVQNWIAGLRK
jgi:eukaryotic-like serine/threonine-protein kinase